VRNRATIVVLVLLALLAATVTLWPGREGPEAADEETDADDPIVAPSRVVAADGESRVVLDSAEIQRIGLTMVALSPASSGGGRRMRGQVIPEPERRAAVRAPVSGRLAAAEGRRWPALGERVEAGTPLGRVSDARPLTAPLNGTVTAVSARPGEIVEAGQVLLELSDQSRPVVRVVWPVDAGRPQDRLQLIPDGGASPVDATLIGPASEADPLTRQPTYLYRSRGRWPGAVPGTPVTALIADGTATAGVLVPDPAVVQWEGLGWTYVRKAAGQFGRVRVPTNRPAPGGWIVGPPLAPGDSVVVTGVQELLSEEFRARVTVGEESGE
jgi:biotin carboxyl carrier protein